MYYQWGCWSESQHVCAKPPPLFRSEMQINILYSDLHSYVLRDLSQRCQFRQQSVCLVGFVIATIGTFHCEDIKAVSERKLYNNYPIVSLTIDIDYGLIYFLAVISKCVPNLCYRSQKFKRAINRKGGERMCQRGIGGEGI